MEPISARGRVETAGDPLQQAVGVLRGVGPALCASLEKLGIVSVGDLLYHLPRRYEDRTNPIPAASLRPGEPALIKVRITGIEHLSTHHGRADVLRVNTADESGSVTLVFFNQPYLQQKFTRTVQQRNWLAVYGTPKQNMYGALQLESPTWEELKAGAEAQWLDRIVPVYPSVAGLTQNRMRELVLSAVDSLAVQLTDPLPEALVAELRLLRLREAVRWIHFPGDFGQVARARRRIVFDEFLLFQLQVARRRARRIEAKAAFTSAVHMGALMTELRALLPFELTAGQKRAIAEIAADVALTVPMNRMLQGDVGSGKTAVAAAAMLMAHRAGFQCALMAPTEILAQQHAETLSKLLTPAGIVPALVTGSMRRAARVEAAGKILLGTAPVVIGTHALLQDAAQFHKLGLVVIDEQHRFGVGQRRALMEKGAAPHTLFMTATPIPRTLMMTLYGDLDSTVLTEMPPGRVPIVTHLKKRSQEADVFAAAAQLLRRGRQAYVVCPAVESIDESPLRAAVDVAREVESKLLPGFRVGLLHGQMKSADKDRVMAEFKEHTLDVLVATTVIEVGVDVPNASIMIVQDADRFGLSQLHQLRGRVGRGDRASYCILLSDQSTDAARARLETMVSTSDGFKIAEMDLELRGPGEFFGTRQSGMPEFRTADPQRDHAVLVEARDAAIRILSEDALLARPEHRALRRALDDVSRRQKQAASG